MPKGQLYINGLDAYTEYGVSLDPTSLSALMTPPANKPLPSNSSRLRHGKENVDIPRKKQDRDLTLTINISAPDEMTFVSRYAKLCEVFANGKLRINTTFLPGVYYNFEYISCNQFTQFMRGIGSFSLKLNEPNPANRE